MRTRLAVTAAVGATALALPSTALAGRAIVKSINNPMGGTTGVSLCFDVPSLPGVQQQPFTFTFGDLQFTYDPTGTCSSGSGSGATGGSTG